MNCRVVIQTFNLERSMKAKIVVLALCGFMVAGSASAQQGNPIIESAVAFAVAGSSFGYCAGKYGNAANSKSCMDNARNLSGQMIPSFNAEAQKTCANAR